MLFLKKEPGGVSRITYLLHVVIITAACICGTQYYNYHNKTLIIHAPVIYPSVIHAN